MKFLSALVNILCTISNRVVLHWFAGPFSWRKKKNTRTKRKEERNGKQGRKGRRKEGKKEKKKVRKGGRKEREKE